MRNDRLSLSHLMDTDKNEPIYKAESRQLVGCAMEVLNELGHGFHEKPYENALVVEFRLRGIPYEQQRPYDILYKQEKVGGGYPGLACVRKNRRGYKSDRKDYGHGEGSPGCSPHACPAGCERHWHDLRRLFKIREITLNNKGRSGASATTFIVL